jgi:hypothetical protein
MFASTYFLGTYSGAAFIMLSSETSPLTAAAMIKFTTDHPATTRPCLRAIEVASIAMYQSEEFFVLLYKQRLACRIV